MDYRKNSTGDIMTISVKKKILFPQLIVPHVFAWLSVIIQKLIRNMLMNIEGVKGVFFAQGQMQIILGTGCS